MDSLAFKVVAGFVQQARAETLGISQDSTRYHVNLWLNGGPIRFAFDHWIKLGAGEDIGAIAMNNQWLATAFTSANGMVTGTELKTMNYNGVLVPYLFQTKIANGKGGSRSASDILNNMMVMRGFASKSDGHDVNSLLVQVPVTGMPSLQGMMADQAENLFAGVMVSGTSGSFFASTTNKAYTKTSASPTALMSPFQVGTSMTTSFNLKASQQAAYDTAMAYMKTYARSNRVGAATLNKNLENAAKKIKAGLGDIEGFWTEAVARYKTAMLSTVAMTTAGINDVYLDGAGQAIYGYPSSEAGVALGRVSAVYQKGTDMRDVVKRMHFADLPEQFALAEYVLRNDLSNNIGIFHNGFRLDSALFPTTIGGVAQNVTMSRMDSDMDGANGRLSTLLIANRFYSGILAGILEFKDSLNQYKRAGTNANLWNESVLQVSSEFARSVAPTGGTGHGYNNMVTSIYSGAIQNGPYVTGNLLMKTTGNGTNGAAADVDGYKGSQGATPGVAAVPSSLVGLMRLNSNPWENSAPPLVTFNESTGVFVNNYGKSKLVGG
jgi:hypothetical protein